MLKISFHLSNLLEIIKTKNTFKLKGSIYYDILRDL